MKKPNLNLNESEIHQILGGEKIEEICNRHLLAGNEKKTINLFFQEIRLNNLERAKRVIADISDLISFPKKEKTKISCS
ncbi:MAG: hypothetical protein Q8N22_02195 [bacterium]|nr:hypothetical protein [bacterium]